MINLVDGTADLQKLIDSVIMAREAYDMRTNKSKTKVSVVSRNNDTRYNVQNDCC